MAVATKARTKDTADLATLEQTIDVLSAQEQMIAEQQRQTEQDALAFLSECLPVLAGGGKVAAARLKAALDLVGWTVEQYRVDVQVYQQIQDAEKYLAQYDREAIGNEIKASRVQREELRQRIIKLEGQVRAISATAVGNAQLLHKLRGKGLLPDPNAARTAKGE